MNNIHIRRSVPADGAFVFATWLKSLYYGNSWFREIEKEHFMTVYRTVISKLVRESVVEVACLSDDPNVLIGYMVHSGPTLHYIYVKKAWRQFGVAKLLVGDKKFHTTSHLTNLGLKLKKDLAFNPFL